MKILVTAKRVTDPDMKIKVKPDGSGIVTDGMNYKINPFDEIAVEQALRIKEKGTNAEVVVFGFGGKEVATEIRSGLAMGADRGIHVLCDTPVDSSVIAKVLAKVVANEKPDFIIMGKQAVDDDSNQAAQMLAGILGVPQACFASKVELAADGKSAVVTREVDGGLETIQVNFPAVITADLRLNEPRYASLPGIMKAKKKKIDEVPVASLGVDATPLVKFVKMTEPASRKAGIKVADVPTLIQKLKDEAKVL
ncbi:MAG: electron transfer flavoprotein subunit beta/FixA family protein [Myxococcota bacterium]